MLAWAVQTSPEGLTARAEIESVPGPSASTRRTSNEPLGPRVMAWARAARSASDNAYLAFSGD
jgi:hypothetical protein